MAAQSEAWIAAGSSVRGTSHEKSGQPCQDAQLVHQTPEGELIIAVADGAGSARYSKEGATAAVQAAIDFLEQPERMAALRKPESPWQEVLKAAARHALSAVNDVAAVLEAPVKELASTLLLVVATREHLFVLQIGDGAIVRGTSDGPDLLCQPLSGEYINEVIFLVSRDAIDHAKLAERSGPAAPLVVFSDGLQMLALRMPQCVPEPGFFKPLFQLVSKALITDTLVEAEIVALLSSARVRERADDDLTLVLAAPKGTGQALIKEGKEDRIECHEVSFGHAPSEGKAEKNERAVGPEEPQWHKPPRVQTPRIEAPNSVKLAVLYVLGIVTGVLITFLWFHFRYTGVDMPGADSDTVGVQISSADWPRQESSWNGICAHDLDCVPFLSCIEHRCRTRAHLGEYCGERGGEGDVCVAGAVCSQGICKKPKSRTDGRKKSGGVTCEVDGDCPRTLLCVQSRCAPQRHGPGQACHWDADCDDGFALICAKNRCEPRSR